MNEKTKRIGMINDLPVWYSPSRLTFNEYSAKMSIMEPVRKYCPICNQEFQIGDSLGMMMCNNRLFPNSDVHTACVPEGKEMETAHMLTEKYELLKSVLSQIDREYPSWSKIFLKQNLY